MGWGVLFIVPQVWLDDNAMLPVLCTCCLTQPIGFACFFSFREWFDFEVVHVGTFPSTKLALKL